MTTTSIQADLERLCTLAKELGATAGAAFPASGVVVDERVLLKCRVPLCHAYGTNLMCPPIIMRPAETRGLLRKYSHALLVQQAIPISGEMVQEKYGKDNLHDLIQDEKYIAAVTPRWQAFDGIMAKLEAEAFRLGYRFAAGFGAGTCLWCPQCVAVKGSQTCRHPFRARPSMEAVGIDIMLTAANAGLPMEVPAKDNPRLVGLLLID